jgi:VanZ family protein
MISKKQKQVIKRIITAILVLGWMCMIGSFSSQSGSESTGLSMKAANVLVTIEDKLLNQRRDEQQRQARALELQYPVRKLAHMSEYAILAMLLIWHLGSYQLRIKWVYILTGVIASGYATTDEIHQLFVSGRSGNYLDVGIDSIGALLGILLWWVTQRIVKK